MPDSSGTTDNVANRRAAVRVLQWTAVGLAALLAAGFVTVLVLSSTDWGRERVRRFVLAQLRDVVSGQVTIGRIRGNLLNGATVDAFAIRDSAGNPFIVAEQVSARYRILDLLSRRIDLRNVRLVRPLVVIERPPGGKWNYERIFPQSDSTKPEQRDRRFDWIIFRQVTVLDGHLIVRTPWKPDTTLSRAAQDSSARDAVGGGTRLMVVPASNGYQKVVELREVTGRAPMLRIAQPGFESSLVNVASLRMVALPFRPPSAVVRDLAGMVRFTRDSVWWRDVAVKMPGSSLRGDGRYALSTGDLEVAAQARPGALADFRFVLPRFPSEGGGPFDFRLEWRGTTEEYVVRNADLRTQGARLRGRFAISFADTFAIHDTDIRFANVSTKLIEQLAPDFSSPRRGTLDGHLQILGGRNAMQLDGSVAFHDPMAGTSRATGRGAVGYVDGGFRMRNLRVRVDPLQVALIKALSPDLAAAIEPVGGTLVGSLSVNGSTTTAIALAGDVEHRDRGGVSRLAGSAAFRLAGPTTVNADLTLRPLSLGEVGLFAPDLRLRGTASGELSVRGALSDLSVETRLTLADGGIIAGRGRFDVEGRTRRYDFVATAEALNLNAAVASGPVTSLTARVRASGTGFGLATMNASIAAEFDGSSWRDVTIHDGTLRMTLANGLARVERLLLEAPGARIEAAGTFGVAAGRSGELRYQVAIDSLGAFNRWIPGADEPGVVRPRRGLVARAVERARADSLRMARANEVERAATGRPMPVVPVDTPRAIARGALRGRIHAAGVLRGNIREFDTRGRLSAEDVLARGNAVRSLRAEYAWSDVRTPRSTIALAVEAGGVSAAGFAFDTLEGRMSYRRPAGELRLAGRQGDDRLYSVNAAFVTGTRREVRLREMAVRMDTTEWRLARTAVIHWHPAGMEVHDLELRSNTGGLVYANGMLPTEGNANLVLDVRNLQVGEITALLQSDVPLRGILTARGVLQGSTGDPTFRGAFGLVNGDFNGSVIPTLQGTLAYADARLVTHVETVRDPVGAPGGAPPSMIADAELPINLAFTGVTGPRLLDLPLRADVRGDSLPLDLIPALTDAVERVRGIAAGQLAIRGTLRRPSFTGALTMTRGSLRVVPTGMVVRDMAASLRMARDTVWVDSIAGRSGQGTVRLAGRVLVGSWRDPEFNLHLVANEAEVLNNDRGRMDADAGLSLTGPFRNAYLAGLINIRQGVGYVPEPSSKRVINAGDPAVFAVMDTSIQYDRELFPTSNPLLEKLRIDVDLTVNRNTWLRSRDANIEMFTEEPVRIRREADALALTGVVSTDRGEYTFLSKRFAIKRGSATFVGGPELNPTIQATGEYEVNLAGRPTFNVRVLIGGTLRLPKLTLESDAQPPIPQSDLLSYLAFGQSTSSLLQLEGSGLTGATATGNLIGVGAELAMRRMGAIALGVMADEIEGDATRGLGADVLNITPGELPDPSAANVVNFFESTRVEAGKYLSPYFFVALQAQRYPGVRAQYRNPRGWRYEAALEPRYLFTPPSLAVQPVPAVTSFGFFIIREWRF
jgi:translocation and assembly module TamB